MIHLPDHLRCAVAWLMYRIFDRMYIPAWMDAQVVRLPGTPGR